MTDCTLDGHPKVGLFKGAKVWLCCSRENTTMRGVCVLDACGRRQRDSRWASPTAAKASRETSLSAILIGG